MIPGENPNSTVEVNVVAQAKKNIARHKFNQAHDDYGDTTPSGCTRPCPI
jgi:hypothetical protein